MYQSEQWSIQLSTVYIDWQPISRNSDRGVSQSYLKMKGELSSCCWDSSFIHLTGVPKTILLRTTTLSDYALSLLWRFSATAASFPSQMFSEIHYEGAQSQSLQIKSKATVSILPAYQKGKEDNLKGQLLAHLPWGLLKTCMPWRKAKARELRPGSTYTISSQLAGEDSLFISQNAFVLVLKL